MEVAMATSNSHMLNPILNSSIIEFALQPLEIYPPELGFSKGLRPGFPSPMAKVPVFEFHDNGDVTFNVYIPDVKTVQVAGAPGSRWGEAKHDLVEISKGWFQGRISGIPTGFLYMSYFFDGKDTLYDRAPMGHGYGCAMNYIDVPEPNTNFYYFKDVPHGAIRNETYFSSYTGKLRNCWVYTPPEYDRDINNSYPVLYIQHGGGENETGWFWQGKLNYIIDNLLVNDECAEMIIVANNGYADPVEGNANLYFSDLSRLLKDDCIPFIEKRFRVETGKQNRAMAGLSMGSFQTQMCCFNHPEIFDYIGVFSGHTGVNLGHNDPLLTVLTKMLDFEKIMENPAAFNAQHKLLYYGKGLSEGGDELPLELEILHNKGIQCEFFTCEGIHEWQVWRKTALDFLKRLFR
jgi:enterochelin esterase-like enzyme